MNVYDFDGTILDGDSEDLFFDYVVKNCHLKFSTKIKYYFYTFLNKSGLGKYPEVRDKRYCFFPEIKDNLNNILDDLWKINKKRIKKWYLAQQDPSDIISSATPRFILEPIMKELNVKHFIACDFDFKLLKRSYNYGQYKVENLFKEFPNIVIDNFYSDSLRDLPLAKIAKTAYRVYGEELVTPFESKRK